MIKIETRKRTIEEYGKKREKQFLVVNGIEDEESFFDEKERKYAHFYNDEIIDLLISYSFKEIGQHFPNFSFGLDEEWWEDSWLDVSIYSSEYYKRKIPCIAINMQVSEWENWAKPWSISTLAKQFELNVALLENSQIKYYQRDGESVLNGFGVEYFPSSDSTIIDDELSKLLEMLEVVVRRTNKNLLSSIDTEAVLTYFQFPGDIKTSCKQYLVYFAQFIADMGINVDTELKEELNHTLFKIVPKDKTESLDKIREALDIYLNAPNDKDFQMQVINQTDIAVKQWEANIYHLKSQLSLSESIIQAKNAAIEALQISNYQYRQLLESHTAKKESDKEEILKGTVEIKDVEIKGLKIKLPEIFRRLKRLRKK